MAFEQKNDGNLCELALFAGAGGGILGGKLLGWRTVCAVERDAYAAQVLAQRQNDGCLEAFPIWSDITSFRADNPDCAAMFAALRAIAHQLVISGGFPCQDISAAGKGAGITGERSGLWNEMARIIGEIRPAYAFVENSPMLTKRGLGTVLADLAALGFDAEWGVLSAADVGAPHLRERIWILSSNTKWQLADTDMLGCDDGQFKKQSTKAGQYALGDPASSGDEMGNPDHDGCVAEPKLRGDEAPSDKWRAEESPPSSQPARANRPVNASGIRRGEDREQPSSSVAENDIPNPNLSRPQGAQRRRIFRAQGSAKLSGHSECWLEAEQPVCGVADGLAHWVDRLKAIGNGQVPRVAATAFTLLRERLNELR